MRNEATRNPLQRRTGAPALAAAALLAGASLAADRPPYDAAAALMGASIYKTYCASCHGRGGRGDGPLADQLRYVPADLTRLAARNGGRYPFDKVARAIDGRDPAKGHGNSDMPVWGDAFAESREGYSREKVKERIDQLAHYLASVQEPAK